MRHTTPSAHITSRTECHSIRQHASPSTHALHCTHATFFPASLFFTAPPFSEPSFTCNPCNQLGFCCSRQTMTHLCLQAQHQRYSSTSCSTRVRYLSLTCMRSHACGRSATSCQPRSSPSPLRSPAGWCPAPRPPCAQPRVQSAPC